MSIPRKKHQVNLRNHKRIIEFDVGAVVNLITCTKTSHTSNKTRRSRARMGAGHRIEEQLPRVQVHWELLHCRFSSQRKCSGADSEDDVVCGATTLTFIADGADAVTTASGNIFHLTRLSRSGSKISLRSGGTTTIFITNGSLLEHECAVRRRTNSCGYKLNKQP